MSAKTTRAAMRDATLRRDHAAIVSLLAEDVVLRSPVVRFPFEGRADVADVYRALLDAFDGFDYIDELGDEDGLQMLRFRSTVLGRSVEAVTLLRINTGGEVAEVVVQARPLVAVAAIGAAMGPRLARRRGRAHALAVTLLSRPLPPLLELAEPLLPRLVRRPPS